MDETTESGFMDETTELETALRSNILAAWGPPVRADMQLATVCNCTPMGWPTHASSRIAGENDG